MPASPLTSRLLPGAAAICLGIAVASSVARADSLEGGDPSDRTRLVVEVEYGIERALVVPAWNDVLVGGSVRARLLEGALPTGARGPSEDGGPWALERRGGNVTLVRGERRIPLLASKSLLPGARELEAQPLARLAASLESSPGAGQALAALAWEAPGGSAWLRARVRAAAERVSLEPLAGLRGWYRVAAHGSAPSPQEHDVRVELPGEDAPSLVFLADEGGVTCIPVNGIGVAMHRVRTLFSALQPGTRWPEASGPDFVIALARRHLGEVTRPSQLAILQAVAGPPVVLDDAALARWKQAATATGSDEALRRLVTLAGRRNADPAYRLTQNRIEEGAIVLADLSLPGVVIPAFADGGVEILTPEDFAVTPGAPLVAGDGSPSAKLKALEVGAR
ncbi:MAG: hypothetical protein AB7T63_16960 [Planctomycetota bacterium]